MPVDVAPLQRQELAGAHPGAQGAQHPRMPARVRLGGRVHEMRGFLARERLNDRLWFIPAAQVAPHPAIQVLSDANTSG